MQTSCTMDQNLARLQNPHRFLRENRFLDEDDPSESAMIYGRPGENIFTDKIGDFQKFFDTFLEVSLCNSSEKFIVFFVKFYKTLILQSIQRISWIN